MNPTQSPEPEEFDWEDFRIGEIAAEILGSDGLPEGGRLDGTPPSAFIPVTLAVLRASSLPLDEGE